ncbi:MATE efflux family protein [Natronomonas pharaonis DSM 2160]|uniref:Multidrug-efflux transporter n=1 Tax=Natronomonas pharaonis (strain ATCC 35678 / DSM 2160 / CIP 103997 / JCM 8858 / NBRC 14720 / NCIMB 2260 / Gabara) TaxID=348780 RepID=A0A1U7EXJ3_NATPD|nr:MATE family efflux transporter [Natronomonas pharaonis]CAI49894.1 MATE efflux family protein [Natronomonas pharaonis DSM 2160]
MPGAGDDVVDVLGRVLDRLGIIDAERLRPTIELAWPRIVTGFAIMSKQTADLAMVGIAVGTAGTAGLAFALGYWSIVVLFGLGLAGGTVSLVSQNYGGGRDDRASLVVKQSALLAALFAAPVMAIFSLFGSELISILGATPEEVRHGTAYLLLIAPAVLFELLNLIASRTYTGVGDTFTEMVIRSVGAVLNLVFSALFVFGLGMGVAGVALGTTLSTGIAMVVLGWGMFGHTYGGLGMKPSPVPVSLSGPFADLTVARQLLEVAAPEIARRVAQGLTIFPLLWIAASFGPVVVTALEVARRVRALIDSVNWGMSLASSSLVGQRLGAGEETAADAYGAGIIRLTMVVYLVVAAIVVALATPIAGLFVSGSEAVAVTAAFVAVAAVSAIGLGLDGTASGVLVGAGDTRRPFVASLIGRYLFALPAAFLGLVTPLGVGGLYLALVLESFVPGGINYGLYRSGRWKVISRRYRPGTDIDK